MQLVFSLRIIIPFSFTVIVMLLCIIMHIAGRAFMAPDEDYLAGYYQMIDGSQNEMDGTVLKAAPRATTIRKIVTPTKVYGYTLFRRLIAHQIVSFSPRR